MADCLYHIATNIKPILTYSAWYFERIGQYQECLDNPNMNYNFIELTVQDQQANAGFLGLCLPKACTVKEIQFAFDQLFLASKVPLIVSHIENDLPNVRHPFSWVFFLTFILAISCIVLVIYASLTNPKNHISAFSIQESLKIFKTNPKSNLNILNGVRSLSMVWVILGHIYENFLINSLNIRSSVQKNSFQRPFFLIIEAGLFAVDVFFFISGLLLALVFLKEKSTSAIKYPMAIIQRILRLWPSYIFALLVYYSVYVHLGSGPFWGLDHEVVEMCSSMWRPIFFVDNLVKNGQGMCMNWGWYLQNDVQLFIASICLLYIYKQKPAFMKVFIWLLMIGSIIFTFMYTLNHNVLVTTHLSDIDRWGTFVQDVYFKPWARCPPYFLGLFFGILHFQYEQTKKNPLMENQLEPDSLFLHKMFCLFSTKKIFRFICQWAGVGLIFFLVFIPRTLQTGMQWPQWLHSLYGSSAKFFFVFSVYLLILPSLLGCKESLMKFCLDTNFFNFIAKISFCTYLIHLILIETWVYSRTYSQYYTNLVNWPIFCGILVLSMFFGLLMTLIIQVPFSKLQKSLISSIKEKITQMKIQRINQKELETEKKLSETLLTQETITTQTNQESK